MGGLVQERPNAMELRVFALTHWSVDDAFEND